jgi:hypothetical protein
MLDIVTSFSLGRVCYFLFSQAFLFAVRGRQEGNVVDREGRDQHDSLPEDRLTSELQMYQNRKGIEGDMLC